MFPHFQKTNQIRIIGFDILRAIAIVFVLFNHSGFEGPIARFGWLGVDLFFVLSGFLISSLLFQEYKSSGKIRVRRFLIRRSLKILPPFYFFIIVSLFYGLLFKGNIYRIEEIFAEVFFLQNYLPGIWRHTWSLGLEEQFYTSLIIILAIARKYRVLDRPTTLLIGILSVLGISLALKFHTAYLHRQTNEFFFVETHLRIEGVLFGILLAYCYQFTDLLKNFRLHWAYPLVFGLLMITPGFFINGGSYFMNTAGLTMANIGFAFILLATILIKDKRPPNGERKQGYLIRLMSMIGIHSYSIYLWHLNIKEPVTTFVSGSPVLTFVVYIFSALVVGILLSLLVERPILNWRNKRWT